MKLKSKFMKRLVLVLAALCGAALIIALLLIQINIGTRWLAQSKNPIAKSVMQVVKKSGMDTNQLIQKADTELSSKYTVQLAISYGIASIWKEPASFVNKIYRIWKELTNTVEHKSTLSRAEQVKSETDPMMSAYLQNNVLEFMIWQSKMGNRFLQNILNGSSSSKSYFDCKSE